MPRLSLKFIWKHLRELVIILRIIFVAQLINKIWLQWVPPCIVHRTLIVIHWIICVKVGDTFVILTLRNSLVPISLEIQTIKNILIGWGGVCGDCLYFNVLVRVIFVLKAVIIRFLKPGMCHALLSCAS